MIRKEQVKRAIKFQGPEYAPILYFNKDKEESDIILIDVVQHFMGKDKNYSEYGFVWEREDKTMGQPKEELIKSWDDFSTLKFPDPLNKDRFSEVKKTMELYPERYYIASLVLTGFTIMTFLRGFANTLEELYLEPEKTAMLADKIFGFEEGIIKQLKAYGFDGVAFYDDWGDQNNLLISPKLWRDFFKPRYKKQIELCHENGLDVYFHSCGNVYDIIPDFIEIGVDMLNISQPNLYDIAALGKNFGGKVCFVCPISYQTTSITGSREDIFNDAKLLIDSFGKHNGGFIGYVEEYASIGMSDENYRNCIEAFKTLGKY
jgi:uroporphyrinogen-III decarboxylase